MKTIPLTQGKVAIVDDEDFERVSRFKWFYCHGYAKRKPKTGTVYLHRFILKTEKGVGIDHKNGDGLDNRKRNLRACNQSLNGANQRISIANTSGFKGVSYHKALGYWTATLKVNQKAKVKYRKTKEDAASAYNEMAIQYFGDFARLNVI